MNDDRYEYGINQATRVLIGFCTRVIFVVLGLVLFYLAMNYGFRFGRSLFYAAPVEASPGHDVEITITDYDTYESLAQKLYEAGVISDERSFVVQGSLYEAELFPGTYTLNTSQTIRDMLISISETASEYEAAAESESAIEAASETMEEVLTGEGEGD